MNVHRKSTFHPAARVRTRRPMGLAMVRSTLYEVAAYRAGVPLWREAFHNLVTTQGLNDSLDKQFRSINITAQWYIGLTEADPVFAPGDTMASHPDWAENVAYSEATRPQVSFGVITTPSITSSVAAFTISGVGTQSFGGAFLVSSAVKGVAAGTLYGGGAFAQNRDLIALDVLEVTVTLTAAAA